MRIVIDLEGAQTESRFRGIGRYSLSLAKSIARNRKNHDVFIVLSGLFPECIEEIRAEFFDLIPPQNILVWTAVGSVKMHEEGNSWRRSVAEKVKIDFFARLEPDIIHVSSLFEGFVDDAITCVKGFVDRSMLVSTSLYDLIPLLNPSEYLEPNPDYEKFYCEKIEHLKSSTLLLAISEYAKQECVEVFGEDIKERIVNISTGASETFEPVKYIELESKNILEKFQIVKEFVLYAGGVDERKNLPRLIRGYAEISPKLRRSHQLVFAGKIPKGHLEKIKKEASLVGLGIDELIFTGYVTDAELVGLYNLCKLYVFPSWHEGFGLPALEAMKCGAAVIGANTTSLPEVIGNKSALFDPYSEKAITTKIKDALTDDDFRKSLISQGLERSKLFTWDKSAAIMIGAFEELTTKTNRECAEGGSTLNLINEISKIRVSERPSGKDIIESARCIDLNNKTILARKMFFNELSWRIEGPFDSSYSLALLNRETALEMNNQKQNISLYSTEGPGDFDPNLDFLRRNLPIKKLYEKSKKEKESSLDIVSRNLYPPRVNDMKGEVHLLHHYAWEESGFPREWVNNFNAHLDGITCLSRHVQKVLIDNGVSIPMSVSGCGVDHWERISTDKNYTLNTNKFRFLHVSSCFPRKGVETLLSAFGEAFSRSDDVTLIIKTFSNPHNEVFAWLEGVRKNNLNYPHVVIIEDDLKDAELKALYTKCDVLVSPSCAEGFGLPMAEAMLSGLPVITTGWSGQLDFCNLENSWLIDFEFERAQTHFGLFSSVWAKPKVDALKRAMLESYNLTDEERRKKARAGRNLLLSNYKWTDVVSRYMGAVREIIEGKVTLIPKIAWISTWNTKCGIATYSAHLIKNMPPQSVRVLAPYADGLIDSDDSSCIRSWNVGKGRNELGQLSLEMDKHSFNIIVIQFNYGFYNHAELSEFISAGNRRGLKIIVVLHSTVDPKGRQSDENYKLEYLLSSLKGCHRVLVHSVADLNRLKIAGLVSNVTLFPHGVLSYEDEREERQVDKVPLIASYGFCLPHKGLEELVQAVVILRKKGIPIRLRLINAEYPAPESAALVKTIRNSIQENDLEGCIEFNSEFLEDNESLELLSDSDLIVFPYQHTGESASGAVRYGLASNRPVAISPLEIFDDVKGAAFQLEGCEPIHIAEGIEKILASLSLNDSEVVKMKKSADMWRSELSYAAVGQRFYGLCSALLNQKNS